jgi:hypothetical protein
MSPVILRSRCSRPRGPPGAPRAKPGSENLLRLGQARAQHAGQCHGDVLGRFPLHQHLGDLPLLVAGLLGQQRIGEDALAVEGADVVGRRRAGPFGADAGFRQQALRAAAPGGRHQQDADALAAGAAGAAGAVLQRLGVVRQLGMDDEGEVGKVDAAGGDVGGDADARPPVAQRLQRDGCARAG